MATYESSSNDVEVVDYRDLLKKATNSWRQQKSVKTSAQPKLKSENST